jgi:hypothetical protein
MFKEDLGALRTVTNFYLGAWMLLCAFIFIEMGYFRSHLQSEPDFNVNYLVSPISFEWLQSFFGVMSTFYAQQYFFSIRKELMYPTTRRLRKTTLISMSSLFVICLMIGNFQGFC